MTLTRYTLDDDWREHLVQHERRAAALTDDQLKRRKAGLKHPVWDFLYEYYPIRIAHLQRWHPGVGVAIADDGASAQAGWKWYVTENGVTFADVAAFMEAKQQTVDFIEQLLRATTTNPTHFDCFGLHEWAMVYATDDIRHDLPLRLGAQATDKVVEDHQIKCTHFDAFRFFTPAARSLNFTVLERSDQVQFDQQGCLHANMDLYKWATKLGPLVPGSLWLDTFALAKDVRVLDMEASPYDCRSYGFGVVAIETPAGKQEYVARQRALAARADKLRTALLSVIATARVISGIS